MQQRHSGEETGREGARLLFAAEPRPTGIVCFSDATACGVMHGADATGRVGPRDLSVVGFDNNPLAQRIQPSLTAVRHDVTAKDREAAAPLDRAPGRRVDRGHRTRSPDPPTSSCRRGHRSGVRNRCC